MEFTRRYLPMEWEERWRREKERRKKVMEEGGEEFERERRRLTWIRAYNDSRMGMKEKEDIKNERTIQEMMEWNDKQETQKYTKDTYPSEIFQAMEELRCCSVLTDLTLSVEHGLTVRAHSLVLAAVSSLIQQMLQQRNEKNEKEIFLRVGPEVSDLGVSAVLEFAYSGSITGLNSKSLAQIQAAALYLGVPRVLEICKEEEERQRKKDAEKNMRNSTGEEHRKVNLQAIRQLWEERVGCDVELEAEGRIFHAHRVILSASSDYFRAMFSSGMKETHQTSVSLLLMGAPELEALLHCCYSGDLFLDWGCIFELTSTALQFQFQPALSLCLNYLEQQMDAHSCLDVAAFAEAYMLSDLHETAEDFVLMHFQEVMATPKFLELPAEKLVDLLRRDGLCVPSELAVFRAVVAWIEADPAQRLSQAQVVMTGVRFPLMTFREFREVRAVNLQMECSGDDDVYLYRTALKEFGFGDSSPVVQHRIRYPRDVLVVVGGDQLNPDEGQRLPSKQLWFANSLRSGTGLVKDMEWRILGEMPEQARFRHGISILNRKLYVAGGCYYYSKADTMKSAYRYDPLNNSWERLSDMQEHRSNFTMVVRGDSLYAIGGDRDISTNLDSVEKYSVETDTWSFTHSLDQPLSGHAAVVWGGEIFISGGFNLKYQCLVSTFLYHPEQGTTYLADMAHDRAQHCMESLARRFYVAGGVCNLREFYTDELSCESYDPISDTWTAFTPLPLCHVGAASAVLEGKLYVLGGYSQEDYSEARLVHRYDPGTQRWENMGKMAGPVTDIRACLLHLPAHLRRS
ncbi:kelch-like protein 33 [Pangasianodon hypophthalmus]|uniref:kelch-like protein 33 n=1 Tax=Pangasianodon hypophthalmus TaxID=310915 RepID=UPI0023078E6B|nr:kelch-like protein 33 [Pangasianodon hypophthalmus]